MKKKILIVARWPVGGINTYMRYIYSDPCFSSYQLDFLLPECDEVRLVEKELCGSNIKVLAVSGGGAAFYRMILKQIIFCNYDLVHSHGFSSALVTAIPAYIFPCKHIVTLHDVFSDKHFFGIKGKIKKYVFGKLLGMVDVLQTVSDGAEKNLLEYMPSLCKPAKHRVMTIINGIDVNRFAFVKARDLKSELGLQRDVFLMGFMGRFMSQKGFVYLVQALKHLLLNPEIKGKIKLVAVGSGGHVREEKDWIQSNGMQNDVLFMPATPKAGETLKGLDLLVMPSLWEACSLLAMEALVAGVPVVGTSCIGLGEVLDGSPAKIVKPRDVDSLKEEIYNHYLDNRRQEFEVYAKIAKHRFDVKNVIKSLDTLYKQELGIK